MNVKLTQDLIKENMEMVTSLQVKLKTVKDNLHGIAALRENWRTEIKEKGYHDRVSHSVNGELKINWQHTDFDGNEKKKASTALVLSHVNAVFCADKDLFDRFMTQYASSLNCQVGEIERELHALKLTSLELIKKLHS